MTGAIAANGELTRGVEDSIAAVDRLAARSAGAAGRPPSDATAEA